MANKQKQIRIAAMAANDVEDIEFFLPIDLWKRAGFIVDVIICENRNSFTLSQSGLKVNTIFDLKTVNFSQYDAIFLPGGPGSKTFLSPPNTAKENSESKLHTNIKKFFDDKSKLLIAICAAPYVLHSILEGKMDNIKYTGFNDDFLKRDYEANWVNERVVVDKNIITAQACGCSTELAFTVIEILGSKELVAEVKNKTLF